MIEEVPNGIHHLSNSTDFHSNKEIKYRWDIQVLESRLANIQCEHYKLMSERSRRIEQLTDKCNDLTLELVMSSPLAGLSLQEGDSSPTRTHIHRKRRRSVPNSAGVPRKGEQQPCNDEGCLCCAEKSDLLQKLQRTVKECTTLKQINQRLSYEKRVLISTLNHHGHMIPSSIDVDELSSCNGPKTTSSESTAASSSYLGEALCHCSRKDVGGEKGHDGSSPYEPLSNGDDDAQHSNMNRNGDAEHCEHSETNGRCCDENLSSGNENMWSNGASASSTAQQDASSTDDDNNCPPSPLAAAAAAPTVDGALRCTNISGGCTCGGRSQHSIGGVQRTQSIIISSSLPLLSGHCNGGCTKNKTSCQIISCSSDSERAATPSSSTIQRYNNGGHPGATSSSSSSLTSSASNKDANNNTIHDTVFCASSSCRRRHVPYSRCPSEETNKQKRQHDDGTGLECPFKRLKVS